jgi:hypothetical protein
LNKAELKISEVKERLKKLNRKINLIELLNGVGQFLIVALLISVVLTLSEFVGFNSVQERTWLYFIGIFLFFISLLYFVGLRTYNLLKPFNNNTFIKLAKFVGKRIPEIKDKLLNVIQLFESKVDNSKNDLTDAAILSELKKLKDIDFSKTVSFEKLKKQMLYLGVTVLFAVTMFLLLGELRLSVHRIFNYSTEFEIPEILQFKIEPKNITVTKWDNVNIKISITGKKPNEISLFMKDKENQVFKEIRLYPDTNKIFNFQINGIKTTTQYFAKAFDIESEHYTIEVVNRPIISKLQLKITPPKYSGLETTIQKENGNITALLGSKVKLNISSSKFLSSGRMVFSDSTKILLAVTGRSASASFTIKRDSKYTISISDTSGNRNIHPIEYVIKTIADEHPTIEVIKPEGDISLTKSEMINTEIKINDDFGFSKLTLKHRLSSTSFGIPEDEFTSENISINKGQISQTVYFPWNLADLMLSAGDIVSFYFEVADNDYISGPKYAKSKIFQLRVPTMEELFNSADVAQEEVEIDLEETLKEAEKLKEDLKNLSNELKKDDKEITWDEKKKVEETAERFEKLQNQIREAQKKINETKQKLDDNDLLSKETLEKYNELQKLMDEMNSEEMRKSLEKMQQQMESMNRDKTQQSLSEMEFNEENFKKSIERTMNLLKRIQIEQKMDEVIKRTEELQKDIDEQKKSTEKSDLSNESEKNELAKKEKEISKQMEKLKDAIEKLKEKMSEFKEMPNETMEEIQKEMESQKNEELSKQTEEMLQKNMKMEAMEQMQQMSQNMEKMKNQMGQMQQQMQQQNQMEVVFEMMKGIKNLLSLSKEEEALKNKNGRPNSNQISENTQSQQEISDGLEKTIKQLSELSQKTFAITPEMGKALGSAKREMQSAMQGMQNGNSSQVKMSQGSAMKYLNEAAQMMKGNMEQMMNGSGGQGSGMMSMMQQMQQMSQQQMGLNQLTKQMQQGKRLTPQQQGEMQRLAEQQEMIRRSLEKLNKENKEGGKSKTLTSNLEKILEEMKEVVTNMNTDKVDDDLIQSQEKILSKLLDAQRSINERDYEKNRESNSANNFKRESPDKLNLDSDKGIIKDELMKIINEGYSKDYEELIRKYYEILEKENTNEISK